MRKRLLKSIATILSLVMTFTFMAPTAAVARRHHQPRSHHHHHHDYSRGWWVLPALIGIGALIHNNSKGAEIRRVEEVDVYDYDSFKQAFINDLDDAELELYFSLDRLNPNKEGRSYKRYCKKAITKQCLQKITTALYEDYEFISIQGDYVYFKKLK